MDRWEYKSVKFGAKGFFGGRVDTEQIDAVLNNLGSQGWELVSCAAANAGYGHTRDIVAILKRESSL